MTTPEAIRDTEMLIAYIQHDISYCEGVVSRTGGMVKDLYAQRIKILRGELAEKEARLRELTEEVV